MVLLSTTYTTFEKKNKKTKKNKINFYNPNPNISQSQCGIILNQFKKKKKEDSEKEEAMSAAIFSFTRSKKYHFPIPTCLHSFVPFYIYIFYF